MITAITHTENGGKTWKIQWKNQTRTERLSYGKLCFVNEQEGWASGSNKIMHTTDGGKNWDTIAEIDDFRLLDVYFFDENHGCTIGNNGIYYTEDGGNEWKCTLRGNKDSMDNKIYFTTRYDGWAIVYYLLYHSRDGGKSWEKLESASLPSLPSEVLCNLIFIDSNEGWILTYVSETSEGRLYQTVDGGENWELKKIIPQATSYDTFCYDGEKSLYLAGADGTIWKYTDTSYAFRGKRVKGGFPVETSIKSSTLWGDVKHSALLQNYPNPFNPETWIPFQLAEDVEVSIRIYSSFGQLVRELSLGRLSAGEYVDKDKAGYWDGRNENGEEVSSGVYFYQIQAGEWSETKRMVIIR